MYKFAFLLEFMCFPYLQRNFSDPTIYCATPTIIDGNVEIRRTSLNANPDSRNSNSNSLTVRSFPPELTNRWRLQRLSLVFSSGNTISTRKIFSASWQCTTCISKYLNCKIIVPVMNNSSHYDNVAFYSPVFKNIGCTQI